MNLGNAVNNKSSYADFMDINQRLLYWTV